MKLLSHLSRVTNPGRNFIPQIDGLRFIAIMGVIACHSRDFIMFHHGFPVGQTAGPVERTLEAGFLGVELFFAISGFILVLPFAKQMLFSGPAPLRLKDYYLRRITRIEPPYMIHLFFLFLLCALVFRHLPSGTHFSLADNPHWAGYVSGHILASLIYSHGFIYGGHPYPNLVLWSLEIEVQFYIVAPLLALVFKISNAWKRRAVIAAGILTPSLLSVWFNHGIFEGISLMLYIPYFLVGFLLVDFYLTKTFSFTARGFKWDLVSLGVLVPVVFIAHSPWSRALMPWLILIGCVAGFHGTLSFWFLSRPLITTIGGMCYTIYMYHFFLLSLFIRIAEKVETHILWLDFLIQYLIMATLIIIVCSVLFALFERPFMRRDWPVRFWAFVRRKGVMVGTAELAQSAKEPAER